MTTIPCRLLGGLAAPGPCAALPAAAVELKISRDALERTLKQQLFSGPDGRYLPQRERPIRLFRLRRERRSSPLPATASWSVSRPTRNSARGSGGACLGVPLAPIAEVSLAPDGEGETIGFRDAHVDEVSDRAS